MKYWEIIAENLSKAGWSLGWVAAVDREGRTIWIVDAHGYGNRFVVRADEKLAAFEEVESAIQAFYSNRTTSRPSKITSKVANQDAHEKYKPLASDAAFGCRCHPVGDSITTRRAP